MTLGDLGTRLFADNHPNPKPDSSEEGASADCWLHAGTQEFGLRDIISISNPSNVSLLLKQQTLLMCLCVFFFCVF